MNGEVKTKPELESLMQEFARSLADPQTQGFAMLMCDNNQAVTKAFLESEDGLGIGAFAELAEVSVDTVRHWVEVGVISVYSLNGKFRFFPKQLLELRSVQQWQGLGLTLEQIKERKTAGMAFVSAQSIKIGDEVLDGGVVHLVSTDDPRFKDLKALSSGFSGISRVDDTLAQTLSKSVFSDVKADFDAQIQKLEEQQQALEQKLASAKALRARLEPKH
jgi:DNA-binding transcriptional MerR regulator